MLETTIKDGTAKLYAKKIKQQEREARKNNKKVTRGDPDYDWAEAYPFTITNLKEFTIFVKNSGGFEIC